MTLSSRLVLAGAVVAVDGFAAGAVGVDFWSGDFAFAGDGFFAASPGLSSFLLSPVDAGD